MKRNRTESAKTNKTGTVLLFPGILGNVPKKTGTLKGYRGTKGVMEKKEYGYGCTKQESGVLFCAADI